MRCQSGLASVLVLAGLGMGCPGQAVEKSVLRQELTAAPRRGSAGELARAAGVGQPVGPAKTWI